MSTETISAEFSSGTGSDVIDLLLGLVSIESVNPDLDPSEHPIGEHRVVHHVAGVIRDMGLEPVLDIVEGDRANVLAELPGSLPGCLVLEAHLDTVPLARDPQPVRLADGRVWGRGACDTKASAAAMLMALRRLAQSTTPRPTVVFAGVVDEEYVMRGAESLARRVPHADAIVIGEPTELLPIRAHNGCIRFAIEVGGVTAHSSKAFLGDNAVVRAAQMLVELDRELGTRLAERRHVLTGVGLLTATEIVGGTAPNVVPDSCVVRFDRRLTPGEEPADALAEVDAVLDDLRGRGMQITRSAPWLEFAAVETAEDHPIVEATEAASAAVLGRGAHEVRSSGATYCTDASRLGGLPAVVVGPGSIDQAHTPEEWVDVQQVRDAVDLYVQLVERFAEQGRVEHDG